MIVLFHIAVEFRITDKLNVGLFSTTKISQIPVRKIPQVEVNISIFFITDIYRIPLEVCRMEISTVVGPTTSYAGPIARDKVDIQKNWSDENAMFITSEIVDWFSHSLRLWSGRENLIFHFGRNVFILGNVRKFGIDVRDCSRSIIRQYSARSI